VSVSYRGSWVVSELIDDRAERWPDEVAVTAPDRDLTYGELRDRAQRVAGGLRALGVEPGDRVATMLDATVDYCAAWHGSAWAGAVEAPINTELRGRFLEHQLRDCGAKVLIVDGHRADRLDGLELPEIEHVVLVGSAAGSDPTTAPGTSHPFAGLLAHEPSPLVRRAETDISTILYTSGTTGPSKGVVHTNRSCCWISQPYIENLALTHEDVAYSMFPLFHTMGRCALVTTSLWVRCPVVLRPRFSVSGFWDDIRATGATWFGYFGAVILFLWREPGLATDRDHAVRVAVGASAPAELQEAWRRRFGVPLVEVYGSTELGLAACVPPDRIRVGSMGKPVAHVELAIHDEDDRPLPPGQRGQIVARPRYPSAMFAGYWCRPEATVEAFRNLWFHTGDAGSLDEDGFLTFTDRMKDSIRRRGENISSFEVEEAVRTSPVVVECAAYAVPSEHSDDEVMVAVVLEPGARFDPAELFGFLEPIMPRFALPTFVRVVDALPKTPSQRVQKYVLRDEGVTDDTIDRRVVLGDARD
jgi:crotonobetaine/carnitine-CoA ligase